MAAAGERRRPEAGLSRRERAPRLIHVP
jgi:hypothetical protein